MSIKSIKQITYTDEDESVHIYVEEVLDAAYGCYIWPSALVMGEFVWYHRRQFSNKTVLEVGGGTSIPTLVLAESANPAHLIISDIPDILPVIHACLERNEINNVWVNAIEWGKFGTDTSIDYLTSKVETEWNTKIDYIIGSDTFYEPSQFENLLVLVSYVIYNHNPNCRFITTYQERSPRRSIQYLLDKWRLKCTQITKEAFDFDELKYTKRDDQQRSEVLVSAGTLSSVFLLEISAC